MSLGFRYTADEKSVDWQKINTPDGPATAAALLAGTGLPLTQAPSCLRLIFA
ncbi:MAG: hypothetical protein P8O79_07085 [Halieaceae bacterium]|nr:hypothetical protein [Halieaceae bacterium]